MGIIFLEDNHVIMKPHNKISQFLISHKPIANKSAHIWPFLDQYWLITVLA